MALWLFDSTHLYNMHYDSNGNWLGAEHVTDPAAIVASCAWRDAALYHGIPWRSYVRERPHLAKYLSLPQAS